MRTSRAFAALLIIVLLGACNAGDDPTVAEPPAGTESGNDAGTATGAEAAADTDGEDPGITIADFAFATSSVSSGDAVPIRNDDGTTHTVTATDGAFDVTVSGGDETTINAPAEPGTYDFTCTIHPSMAGQLVVE
ncbi:cupredoxin family copper-binding protein [soil metagenome]